MSLATISTEYPHLVPVNIPLRSDVTLTPSVKIPVYRPLPEASDFTDAKSYREALYDHWVAECAFNGRVKPIDLPADGYYQVATRLWKTFVNVADDLSAVEQFNYQPYVIPPNHSIVHCTRPHNCHSTLISTVINDVKVDVKLYVYSYLTQHLNAGGFPCKTIDFWGARNMDMLSVERCLPYGGDVNRPLCITLKNFPRHSSEMVTSIAHAGSDHDTVFIDIDATQTTMEFDVATYYNLSNMIVNSAGSYDQWGVPRTDIQGLDLTLRIAIMIVDFNVYRFTSSRGIWIYSDASQFKVRRQRKMRMMLAMCIGAKNAMARLKKVCALQGNSNDFTTCTDLLISLFDKSKEFYKTLCDTQILIDRIANDFPSSLVIDSR